MPKLNVERACHLMMTFLISLRINVFSTAETYHLGYITGSKRRHGDKEYSRPGLQISGAINLAVDEVNLGELGRRGHKLEILVAETYGSEETSILMTADLWTKNISAYIGPQETCVHEGRMAAAFNLPMISYYCTNRETSNKRLFSTFARTRPPDTQISKSVVTVLKAFNWTKISLMYMRSHLFKFYETTTIAKTILSSFRAADISVNSIRYWEEPYRLVDSLQNPFHKLVFETYSDTRIYVILGNIDEHIGLLMALDDRNLLSNGEYWVLGVNTDTYDESEPNIYVRGLLKKYTDLRRVQIFQSYFSIIASAPIGFKSFTNKVNEYRRKPPFNFKNPLENITERGIVQAVPETAYLYDAVHLYAQSLLKALDEKRDPRNGREIISSLHGVHYKSAMGYMVYIDENGDPEGNYTLIALDDRPPKGYGLYPIANFVGKEKNTHLPQLRMIKTFNWFGGKPPLPEPYCGYHGNNCKGIAGEILAGIVGGFLIVFLSVILVLYKNWKYEQELDSLLWKVNFKDIEIKETKDILIVTSENNVKEKQKNWLSEPKPYVRTSQASLSSNPDADFRYSMIYAPIGIYKGRIFAIKKIKKKSIEITREMKKELKILRDLRHDNLNSFIGASTDPPNICIIVEYCSRGSLKDILDYGEIKLDNMFMASLVGDIIQGMIYLHESVIKFHGSLTTSNCLVDSRWVVKISDFGLHEFKRNAELEPADVLKKYHALQYKAPELLRPRSYEPAIKDYQKGDVYSFAIVLYELQGRRGPFGTTDLTVPDILKKVIAREDGIPPFRPPLEQLENSFDFVRDCLIECWAENPEIRPDFKTIRNKLRPLRKGMKPNIFDNMMAMMEKYANNLEVLVDERTDQLSQEKKKTDALLYEMLPPYVAEQLKRGNKVQAESFDCVTIYFSDIVGFTAMSAESTPLQVVDFLNDLYTCFDSTIENYDVYKVETIGDAYMVVSGLPIRNGIQHAGEIASMSLHLVEAIKRFIIRHRPLDKLQLRIGIHSGPVCAGVVGLKMPRYCLFGDTVNTASRMESTGQPLKIHCSMETKLILDNLGGFILKERGYVSIKGKGEKLTYWLIGEDISIREIRSQERIKRRGNNDKNSLEIGQLIVPRSSLKVKTLINPQAFLVRDSGKRLRFASTDCLDQAIKNKRKTENIFMNGNSSYINHGLPVTYIQTIKSSSTSCPCVKHVGDSVKIAVPVSFHFQIKEPLLSPEVKMKIASSAPVLKVDKLKLNSEAKPFSRNAFFQNTCNSAPSSPKRDSKIIVTTKRKVQSNEELEEWDLAPLINHNCLY